MLNTDRNPHFRFGCWGSGTQKATPKKGGMGSDPSDPLCCTGWRRLSASSPVTSCYCRTTQVAVAAPVAMMKHPSPTEKECLLTISSFPPGPQENKPISCHCDRIKMEPSYFCNTMQAGREEKEGQWVRERQIGHHLPIKPMNYGAASFSRKDYKLILSPRDNYSKVQLLASVSVWPCTTGSDTHPFYTFIFSLHHSKSAWWQWFIYRRLFLSSTAILLLCAALGPRSHEPPWA